MNLFLLVLMTAILDLLKNHSISRQMLVTDQGITVPIFFAADEKTEDPTPKKLSEARKKGQVAKSPDLNSAIILIIVGLLILVSGDKGFEDIYRFLYRSLRNINLNVAETNIRSIFIHYMFNFFNITAIIFVTVMIGGTIANLAQSGFLFSTEVLKPNFKKLNPIEGFKNQFSKKSVFNLFKTIMKLVLVVYIAYTFIKANIFNIYHMTDVDLAQIYPYMKGLITNLIFRIAIILLILGVVDLVFQKYDFKKNLRMTKNEIKEEMKQMEGDPKIKSLRKQKQRQLATSRMMTDVPKADVVINNPTHISIAIKYEEGVDSAPQVLAMGVDHVAMKIREIAREYEIPMIEDKPLARLLLKKAKVGKVVPVELYRAMAKVLAEIYRINKKKNYRK
jgi:flagellar biosynthetic protein FlhB